MTTVVTVTAIVTTAAWAPCMRTARCRVPKYVLGWVLATISAVHSLSITLAFLLFPCIIGPLLGNQSLIQHPCLSFSCRPPLSSRCVSGPAATTRVFLTSYLTSPLPVRPCHVSPQPGTLRTSVLHSNCLLRSLRPWRCLWALAIWTATPPGWALHPCTWAPRPSGLGLLVARAQRDLASTIHSAGVGTEKLTRLH